MNATELTARGVKIMLTRAGVDHSHLAIHGELVWNLETSSYGGRVTITGSPEQRTAAFHTLLDRGLTIAPYPDHDEWSRR